MVSMNEGIILWLYYIGSPTIRTYGYTISLRLQAEISESLEIFEGEYFGLPFYD